MKLNSVSIVIIYVLIILVVAALLPTPTVWSPRYGSDHRDPLGTAVLFNHLPNIFSQSEILRSTTPIFNTLKDEVEADNYLFINDTYTADRLDVAYLLDFIATGKDAFISAEDFSETFKDTVGFEIYDHYYWPRPFDQDSVRATLYLSNASLLSDSARVHKVLRGSVLSSIDTSAIPAVELLGQDEDGQINFFRKKIGDGHLYVHLCPAAFSNYELLYENTVEYASACLSYLPNSGLIFDDYYKSGKAEQGSLLSVLLAHPPMQWAWNLALLALVLFMIFGARRKSRAIPIILPYKNESLNYIETVGAMHYNHRNNQHIASKRLKQLKNYLHRRYKIQEADWLTMNSELFYTRTGISTKEWKVLFEMTGNLGKKQEWEVSQLRQFSNQIDNIYSEIKAK